MRHSYRSGTRTPCHRHGRPRAGHPLLSLSPAIETWMAGPSPAMTDKRQRRLSIALRLCACVSFRRVAVGGAEILREMLQRAHHGIWDEPAQRAQRTELHRVAEVPQQIEICLHSLAADDAIDHLHAPDRADAARRALPARLFGAELHGEARLLREVHRVVEHHNAAMADEAVAGGERLIVERRVEQCRREIGTERPAHLHCAGRPDSVPPPMSFTSSPNVTPKPHSNSPPYLMLPASWIGIVPRERPMPISR